ncbi:hypothetical protein ANCCEY_00009 [Ancylostoma ceylanicum]|uniref:Peptidase M28 domain-containing protein n=1 Tax=Ancylostoma ceylanicum TaxID=53326 RepID=A0A0D6MDK2_9BILA|nr:hypothetical protein ANCCEY_00009 [Ancylostoma ceylanicum]
MKLIRSLAHQPDFLKRDVIFLFNEAEESSLQSKPLKFVRRAHGFICQDAWRRVIRAFISFEASGSGLDLAFVQNGHWWHTEFDEARRITPGSLHRASARRASARLVLLKELLVTSFKATLLYLIHSPYLDDPAEFGDQKNALFDFLGFFVVVYSEGAADAVNAILAVGVVVSTAIHTRKHCKYEVFGI